MADIKTYTIVLPVQIRGFTSGEALDALYDILEHSNRSYDWREVKAGGSIDVFEEPLENVEELLRQHGS